MGRTTYLVDTENVGTIWNLLLRPLSKQDNLILFYTENSPGISYFDLDAIIKENKTFELISCNKGKNALDFQLISYLGYLLKSAAKTEYTIISNDTGYDPVVKFWKDKGYVVTRMTVSQLKSRKAVEGMEQKVGNKEMVERLSDILDSKFDIDIEEVGSILCCHSSEKLQQIHGQLAHTFGQTIGSAVYKELKPYLPEIYQLINQ